MDAKAIAAKNGINDIELQGHDALISAKQHKGLLLDAQRSYKGSVQVIIRVTIEVEGDQLPACVAETISRYTFA